MVLNNPILGLIPPGVDEISVQLSTVVGDFVKRACSVFKMPLHVVAIVGGGAKDDVLLRRKSVAVVYGRKMNVHQQVFAMNNWVFLTLILDGRQI